MSVAEKLGTRLERLDSHLAIVVTVHLFTEHLLDQLIDARSPIAARVLRDHRTYSFSVKLALVFHMGLIEGQLFHNLESLNRLRNKYAHEIDVDLRQLFDRGFVDRPGHALFPDPGTTRNRIENERDGGAEVLRRIRDVTFGWLHDVVESLGDDAR